MRLLPQITGLYRFAAALLPQRPHYDWGLRAVKAVLTIAGIAKRRQFSEQQADTTDDTSFATGISTITPFEERQKEAVLLRQAILDADQPKVVGEDEQLFLPLVDDMFPGVARRRASAFGFGGAATPLGKPAGAVAATKRQVELMPGLLTQAHAREATTEAGLVASPPFIRLVLRGARLLTARHSLFVLGRPGAGKSSLLAVLQASHEKAGRRVSVDRLYVKPVSAADLYGSMVSAPGGGAAEWRDGVLSHVLRTQVSQMSPEAEGQACSKFKSSVPSV